MNEIALSLENISKQYLLGAKTDRLAEVVGERFRRMTSRQVTEKETLWALRNVSAEIAAGEVVGFVGHNGAGKSTLLKIISRITRPTSGHARIRGRVGSLIEVGTGFHPELTGRENVYLNGSILGMPREQIDRRFDEIVHFAETEQFVETPVKHYSSGMQVRLAFAVAAHLEPEVLLVDEVLAVGDLAFQEKCLRHFQTLKSQGMTIVVVSHNMSAIQNTCERVLFFEHGDLCFDGDPVTAIDKYRESMKLQDTAIEHVSREGLRVVRLEMLTEEGEPSRVFDFSKGFRVRIEIDAPMGIDRPLINFGIRRRDGVVVCNFNNWYDGFDLGRVQGRFVLEGWMPPLRILPEHYEAHVLVWPWGGGHLAGDLTNTAPLAWTSFGAFTIQGPPLNAHDGVFQTPARKWRLETDQGTIESSTIKSGAIMSAFQK